MLKLQMITKSLLALLVAAPWLTVESAPSGCFGGGVLEICVGRSGSREEMTAVHNITGHCYCRDASASLSHSLSCEIQSVETSPSNERAVTVGCVWRLTAK